MIVWMVGLGLLGLAAVLFVRHANREIDRLLEELVETTFPFRVGAHRR